MLPPRKDFKIRNSEITSEAMFRPKCYQNLPTCSGHTGKQGKLESKGHQFFPHKTGMAMTVLANTIAAGLVPFQSTHEVCIATLGNNRTAEYVIPGNHKYKCAQSPEIIERLSQKTLVSNAA